MFLSWLLGFAVILRDVWWEERGLCGQSAAETTHTVSAGRSGARLWSARTPERGACSVNARSFLFYKVSPKSRVYTSGMVSPVCFFRILLKNHTKSL